MIIMRKHIPIIMSLLFICLLTPGVAQAADVVWQIEWRDNGTLSEQVTVSGRQVQTQDNNWSSSSSANSTILKREVKDWRSYNQLKDKLPVDIDQSAYLVAGRTQLNVQKIAPGSLYSQLQDMNVKLEIKVPGIITGSTGRRLNDYAVAWSLPAGTSLEPGSIMVKFVSFDGFLMGIVIVGLTLIIVLIFFAVRLRKVDRFIDEEYSLEKVRLALENGEPEEQAKQEDDA